MPQTLDRLLQLRLHRVTRSQRAGTVVFSVALHLLVVAAFVTLPELFAEPPQQINYVSVMVVPPAALGLDQPVPPPPAPVPPPSREPPPKKPERAPDPEVPVIKTEAPKPERNASTTPPVTRTPPAGDPPKRQGSAQGNALGVSTSKATLGVEDPNFTYGYYLDRVVTILSGNWVRPEVGSEVENALFYFRIRRDGSITDLSLAQASGSDIFDQAARRAIEASSPLPPLPQGYKRDYLGITLIVK